MTTRTGGTVAIGPLAILVLGSALAIAVSGCLNYKVSCECDVAPGVCDRSCPCDLDCKGWAVVDLACSSSSQCPGSLRCLQNPTTDDSWCADTCEVDSDCGGSECCLTLGDQGNYCFPERLCGGAGGDDGPSGDGGPVVTPMSEDPDGGLGGAEDGGGPAPDAGGEPDGDEPADCTPAATPPGDGHHNAGQDCLSCHSVLGENLRWTIAGTVYASASGGEPVAGATLRLVDADGQVVEVVTADNGNFWTTQPVAFPLQVEASRCPDSARMTSPANEGSCNTSGCHAGGFRIHLP